MTCNETIAYADASGVLHSTKEECCAANKFLKTKEHVEKMLSIYAEEFPDYLTYKGRHCSFQVRNFLELMAWEGYDIIKVRDYEQDTF